MALGATLGYPVKVVIAADLRLERPRVMEAFRAQSVRTAEGVGWSSPEVV